MPLDSSRLEALKANFRGQLIQPGDPGYDSARKVWNGMIDKRPAVIARCTGVSDVISAVNFVRENRLPISVRGGGHNVAGRAVCDDGLVVDLSPMKGIRVDPTARTVRAQTGCLWQEVDRECQAFGLATTGGTVSTTGISGLTLGGGLGYLMGKYGLACDNVVSADVVTADGRFLTASEEENSDLFWAVRGGSGNFGVVTSLEFRVHPVGPMVVGGLAAWPIDQAPKILRFFREFTAKAPEELTTFGALTTSPEGHQIVGILGGYCGSIEEGQRVIQPIKDLEPVMDMMGPMPYLALQSMLDPMAPSGNFNYWKADFITGLPDEAIEVFSSYAPKMPSPLSLTLIEHVHGAAQRQNGGASFAQRSAPYNTNVIAHWTEASQTDANIGWARSFSAALEPFKSGGVYVNYLGEDTDESRVRAAYGSSYDRLATVKAKYDPNNLFSNTINIKPAAVAAR